LSDNTKSVKSENKTIVDHKNKLIAAEDRELRHIQKMYSIFAEKYAKARRILDTKEIASAFDIQKTSNVKLQLFAVKHDIDLVSLASNNNISQEVANLLLLKCSKPHDSYMLEVRKNLLFNPVVYNNLEFFEKLYELDIIMKNRKTAEPAALADLLNLTTYAPVELLLFLVQKANSIQDFGLAYHFYLTVVNRQKEVTTWLEERNPELAGLPFNWVMRAAGIDYDFSKFSANDFDLLW
jgi:hypothetical protein